MAIAPSTVKTLDRTVIVFYYVAHSFSVANYCMLFQTFLQSGSAVWYVAIYTL